MQESEVSAGFDRRFGENVAEARKSKGWSQRRLAEELEVHGVKLDPSAVTRIERGARETKLREAVAMSAALGLELRELTRVVRDSREELQELLDSTVERRSAGRHALAGMAFHYMMVVKMLREQPDLLDRLRTDIGMKGKLDVEKFLREEAKGIRDAEEPVIRLAVSQADHALIAELVAASAENITTHMTEGDAEA